MQPLVPLSERVLFAFVLAWTALWIGIGYIVYREVRGLAELSDTVVLAGGVLEETARTVEALGDVPLIGAETRRVATRARRVARRAKASGRSSREDIEDLAITLWISISAAPTVPLLVLYGLGRLRS